MKKKENLQTEIRAKLQEPCKKPMETCNKMLNNKPASTICEKNYNVNEAKDQYTFSGWKWATMP